MTSIFSSAYNGASCLTFLSKWPTEKSIVPRNPSTFPLISAEESKINYFSQVWEKFCPQQLKLLKYWVQDSEADVWRGESVTAFNRATKTHTKHGPEAQCCRQQASLGFGSRGSWGGLPSKSRPPHPQPWWPCHCMAPICSLSLLLHMKETDHIWENRVQIKRQINMWKRREACLNLGKSSVFRTLERR